MIFGCDISHHQSNPNFQAVKATNIKFVILKATEGVNYTDPCFHTNIQNAINVGLRVGAYHFLRATPIGQQCNDFYNAIKSYKLSFPIAVDVENPSNSNEISSLGKTEITKRIIYFAKFMRSKGYKDVLCYSSKSWFGNYIDTNQLKSNNIKIWLAWYSNANPSNTNRSNICDIWQYASDGKISGINGNVDVNVCYINSYNSDDKSFICDTTKDIRMCKNEEYTFKVTSNSTPNISFGTSNVISMIRQSNIDNNYYYTIKAIGNKNTGCGIFVNGKRIFSVSIILCDTTMDFIMKPNTEHIIKSTDSNITTGNSSIIQTIKQENKNGCCFTTIKAIGKLNEAAGIYINGKKVCIVTIKSNNQKPYCDTTVDMAIPANTLYQVKTKSKNVTTGNSAIIRTNSQFYLNGEYYTKLLACGKSGQAAGIFIDGVKVFVLSIK